MKVLRIIAKGLPFFKNDLELNFIATQRVSNEDKDNLYHIFSNIYLNPTEAFIGINASGKTSILKSISLALNILKNEPINHLSCKDILGKSENVIFVIDYISNSKELYELETHIKYDEEDFKYKIVCEKLFKKDSRLVKTKKDIFSFTDEMLVATRKEDEDFLSDDVSIIIAANKKNGEIIFLNDMLEFTNINILPLDKEIPDSIIKFLDPTIEYLKIDNNDLKPLICLKFSSQPEIVLNNEKELEKFLSSGTIKGIIIFSSALNVLKKGGYLLIDEIENHFNREIVSTLIRFFMDSKINKNGGSLVFTTHYPELLDEYDRNDSIYITRNQNGITVENVSHILTRNDIKKSDAYISGLLRGTTPEYSSYMKLKKYVNEMV